VWLTALYGVSPIGSKVLAQGTPAGQGMFPFPHDYITVFEPLMFYLAEVLQKIAWDAVKAEPLNGLNV
jgi:hypothetical protein